MPPPQFCESCNLQNPPDATNCMKCEGPLAQPAPPPEPAPSGGGMLDYFCLECDLESPPGSTHCVMCGKQVQQPARAARPKAKPAKKGRPAKPRPRPKKPRPAGKPGAKRRAKPSEGRKTKPFRPNLDDEDFKTQKIKHGGPAPPGLKAPISNIKATRVDPQDVKVWLCCDPFRPIPVLKSKPLVKLGRRRDCEMVLPHESVSKVHALVRSLGDEITIEDQSTYGTYHNGVRVRSAKLKAGDVVTIGPYSIEVRAAPGRARPAGEELTRPFRTISSSSEAMQGRLEKVSLDEVLQQIEFYKKTGTLKIFTDEDKAAVLVIYEGAPMYAELGDLRDNEAVFAMLSLERGNFSFMSKVEAGEATMAGTTLTGLLMEANRQKDEAAGEG